MITVFFSGNRSIHNMDDNLVTKFLSTVLPNEPYRIVVGDAEGVDTTIQESCSSTVPPIPCTVYYSGYRPRNLKGNHQTLHVPAQGSGRSWHTCKDTKMSMDCDMHIGLVDTHNPRWRSSGTVANHRRVLQRQNPSFLYCVSSNTPINLQE